MVKIELDIFSGMPNPRWDISHAEKRQLIDRITADRSLILPFNADTGGLGYRGFIVTADKEHSAEFKNLNLPRKFRLGGMSASNSARWLLNTPGANQTTAGDVLQVAQDSSASPAARTAPAQSPDSLRPIDEEPIDPPYEEPPSPPPTIVVKEAYIPMMRLPTPVR